MRVLYDHQLFSLQNHGGGSTYFYELASRLSRTSDVHVDVFMGFHGSQQPFDSLAPSHSRVMGWKSSVRPGLLRYALNEAVTSVHCISAGPWDIYHSTLYRRMPLVRARRTVATNHDCTQERFPELFSDSKRIFKAKKSLYDKADAIICVSESSRKDLMEFYGVPVSKTHVVHLGLPRLVRAPNQSGEFVARLRRPYLLFVGARHSYKNFLGLLNAFSSGGFAREYDLLVVGGARFTDVETAEIQRLGIMDSVQQWDFVSPEVLAEAYLRAELFVSPSLYEGFGLPPLEALSMGCPVLASNSASVPEVCGDAAHYFDPRVEGDLERGIREALGDPDRQRRIALGLETASRYSWQITAEKTLEVYQAL